MRQDLAQPGPVRILWYNNKIKTKEMKKEKVMKYEDLVAMMPKPIFFDLTPEGLEGAKQEMKKRGFKQGIVAITNK